MPPCAAGAVEDGHEAPGVGGELLLQEAALPAQLHGLLQVNVSVPQSPVSLLTQVLHRPSEVDLKESNLIFLLNGETLQSL